MKVYQNGTCWWFKKYLPYEPYEQRGRQSFNNELVAGRIRGPSPRLCVSPHNSHFSVVLCLPWFESNGNGVRVAWTPHHGLCAVAVKTVTPVSIQLNTDFVKVTQSRDRRLQRKTPDEDECFEMCSNLLGAFKRSGIGFRHRLVLLNILDEKDFIERSCS